MNGVGFEILARTPVPKLPPSYPPHPTPPTHTHRGFSCNSHEDPIISLQRGGCVWGGGGGENTTLQKSFLQLDVSVIDI